MSLAPNYKGASHPCLIPVSSSTDTLMVDVPHRTHEQLPMSGRFRILALQALGVAVLAAVIYVVLLRPSEPGDLTGITTHGGQNSTQTPGGPNPPGNGGGGNGSGPGVAGNASQGGGSSNPGSSFGPGRVPGSPPAGGEDGPAGSQYVNAVARVLGGIADAGS